LFIPSYRPPVDASVGAGVENGVESPVHLRVLGPLTILRGGCALPLPASRKVRALVGYLALAPRPVTRSELCELLWDVPNDPRGELRWCLSKMRHLLDEPGRQRVTADRDSVALDLSDCFVDASEICRVIEKGIDTLPAARLGEWTTLFAGELLEGLDLDSCPQFSTWLESERRRFRGYRTSLLEQRATTAPGAQAFASLEEWLRLAPLDPRAHQLLLAALARSARISEGEAHLAATGRRFEAEGIDPAPLREAWRAAKAEGGRSRPQPAKPSIAVLPFRNLSGDATQEYFADGMAEDILTELSRYPDLLVVARNSSFLFRGDAVRAGDVARELGVRYVLEGSVRREGTRVRMNVQLLDTADRKTLWAQRHDRQGEDLLAVQDEVTHSVVAVLPERLQAAALEAASRKTRSSLDAYDHLLHGKYCHHLETPDANSEAEEHFDRAIALDARFASAYAWKACALGQAWNNDFRPRTPRLLAQINELVEHAASLDESNSECHRIMSRLALMQADFAKSDYHLERALALTPNDPRIVVQRGIHLTFGGEAEAAIPWIEKALRLDPLSAHRYYLDLVRALFAARRTGEAMAVLERTPREHWEHYLWVAACHAAQDEAVLAKQAARRALALRPHLSIAAYVEYRFRWKRPQDGARLCDALARAGVPKETARGAS
jgi:TolB-like protein